MKIITSENGENFGENILSSVRIFREIVPLADIFDLIKSPLHKLQACLYIYQLKSTTSE